MKKSNLVQRFFAEEEGMEVMQVVIIAAIACVVIASAYMIYKNVIHKNVREGVDIVTKPQVESPTVEQ